MKSARDCCISRIFFCKLQGDPGWPTIRQTSSCASSGSAHYIWRRTASAINLRSAGQLIFRLCVFSYVWTGGGRAADPWWGFPPLRAIRRASARNSEDGMAGRSEPSRRPMKETEISFAIDDEPVSALWRHGVEASAALVLAHGAGAGMRHRFLTAVAAGLAQRGLATLRYQFPYMEVGRRRPDPPKRATLAVRNAVALANRLAPNLPLFAGGKSFGGRMTSTAESELHMPDVEGLVFLGFPLHPPGRPATERAAHLGEIELPMLFLQGTRDGFADTESIQSVCDGLGERAHLRFFEGADHSFHTTKASGRSDSETLADMLDALADWATRMAAEPAALTRD